MKEKQRDMRARLQRENAGVALILALLFVVLLTVLVVEFSYETQVEASFATNQSSDFEAFLAAKSAVARGMGLLMEDLAASENQDIPGGVNYDEAVEDLSKIDTVEDIWSIGVPFEPLNEATMRTTIRDEYGKINLNALFDTETDPPEEREEMVNTLREFFILYMVDGGDDPTDAILDWLDYGDSDDERDEGAESDYYEGLENPYPCKNGPMDSIEELLLIKGITPELYFGDPENELLPLSEYLTVQGCVDGRVNINTAEPEVIAARRTGVTGSEFDLEFGLNEWEKIRNEGPYLQAPYGAQENKEGPTPVDPYMVSSNAFRIYGDGMQGDVLVRIEAYVFRLPVEPEQNSDDERTVPVEPFRILSWKVIR